MEKLSYLADSLKGSQILAFSKAVKELQQQGKPVFNFTVGDFHPKIFPIPAVLKREVFKAYDEDFTNYPAAEGNLDLREAITCFEETWNSFRYEADEVLVGSGGRPMIYAAFRTIVDREEGIIYALPSWNTNYYTQLVEGKAIEIETKAENGFLPLASEIAPHLKHGVLLCLCSPQNPTGTIFSGQQLKAICELVVEENKRRSAGEKKLYVLFDAMYGALTTNGSFAPNPVELCPEIRPYLFVVNAISKVFAATGLRVGWCLGPVTVLNKMKNVLSHMGAWAPMAEQKAVASYLYNSEAIASYFDQFKEELAIRLRSFYDGIKKLKLENYPIDAISPSGGLYLSIKIDLIGKSFAGQTFSTSTQIASYLLEQSGIALLPFSVFGSRDDLPWFRLSVGTCERRDIKAVLTKFKDVLAVSRTIPQSAFAKTMLPDQG